MWEIFRKDIVDGLVKVDTDIELETESDCKNVIIEAIKESWNNPKQK